jgi:hypothetical protein
MTCRREDPAKMIGERAGAVDHRGLQGAYKSLRNEEGQATKQKRLQAEACNLLIYCVFFGVADGARTHDNRNHNPGLYQLSYSHH